MMAVRFWLTLGFGLVFCAMYDTVILDLMHVHPDL